jgi:N,N-dimethylformamidase
VRFASIAEGAAEIARRRWREEILGEAAEIGEPSSGDPLAAHLLGYCEPWSVAPGERLAVKVSAAGAPHYRVQALRILCGDDTPTGPGLRLEAVDCALPEAFVARRQATAIGSYVRVHSIAACLTGLSVSCFMQPWLPAHGRQTLLAAGDPEGPGWSLVLNADAGLSVELRGPDVSADLTLPAAVAARAWYLVVLRYDAGSGQLELTHRPWTPTGPALESPQTARVIAHSHLQFESLPLHIGARVSGGIGGEVFNGRLERPRIASRWLSDEALARAARHEPPPELLAELVGAWDFGHDFAATRVRALTPGGLDGETVNLPTRAVAGVDWDGSAHDPRLAPAQYAAIHFHEDDLYDAGWDTDFELKIPVSLASGCYALRLETETHTQYLSFFVRPPPDHATAPLAFLASTATYMAYGNYRFQLELGTSGSQLAAPIVLDPEHVLLQETGHLGLSQYDRHRDGSGVHHASRRRPIVNHGPGTDVWNFNADTHLLSWLHTLGQDCDVITDEDLDREGLTLLRRYRCIVTGTHPEYWSSRMWRAMTEYRDTGGRLLYLGGNGFYWRIAWHPTLPGVTELRRPEGGARYWGEEPGEAHLAFTGEYGGLWRRIGRPPESLVGVGTRAIGFERSVPYRRTAASFDERARFLFEGLDAVVTIGESGYVGGAAAGSEVDAADVRRGTPSHALVVAVAADLAESAQPVPEDLTMCHPAQSAAYDPQLHADMVFFETAGGGAVLSVGSVAFAGALLWNRGKNSASRLIQNALRRFLDPRPFEHPGS